MSSPIIQNVITRKKAIAITFDDGPNPVYTPQVLEIFKKANGKATFFMIGEQMQNSPDLVKAVTGLGHEIGNHTYTHPKLTEINCEKASWEIDETSKLIERLTGQSPVLFRPPYLDYDKETSRLLNEKGFPMMIGAANMEASDWERPGVDFILEKTRSVVGNGSILLFHDGYGNRSQTIEAVRILIDELTRQGFELLTVSELLSSADTNTLPL
ncbi:polysaccharide deacetylase family protein [Bacillus salacetis]|uniref:Polysaccharide deacetylase family protein n=1 Tax=Bacillus salacetis TaxID=2315464 RepID=A0A3A1R4Q9_9BACI|nr:polysaccharide deacetylase family protein [Bacillus salacetis]RIW37357.1 polysaccharide deacetylase family protein [Bacillus salacetis]